MSHKHTEHSITCPNCGFHAQHNFCAQCGQETHLHEETSGALLMHFIGHYFHYDSKFWSTLKTLCFKPGALTIAYLEKKRMRYISPISLYIFISAVFFLFLLFLLPKHDKLVKIFEGELIDSERTEVKKHLETLKAEPAGTWHDIRLKFDNQRLMLFSNPDKYAERYEKLIESLPKFVFFMIPFMALLLYWFYKRNKERHFVDHIIFSLHYHTFFFVVLFLVAIDPLNYIEGDFLDFFNVILTIVLFSLPFLYLYFALRKVYPQRRLRTVFYTLALQVCYIAFLFLILKIYAIVTIFKA